MKLRLTAVVTLLAAALAAPVEVSAASSECKGLDQANCQGKTICSWVKAHKTSKGKEIAAFCRKKPEKKTSQASPTPKS
jgi:hypothetical protein